MAYKNKWITPALLEELDSLPGTLSVAAPRLIIGPRISSISSRSMPTD